MANFDTVKTYIATLELAITHEDRQAELIVVNNHERGIHHLLLDCEEPILILEQAIVPLPLQPSADMLLTLLQLNRTLVHGAFAIDSEQNLVLFRDTLQMANLDFNELEASIQALSLALVEHADTLLQMAPRQQAA